jgi:hypothetical protein
MRVNSCMILGICVFGSAVTLRTTEKIIFIDKPGR